MCNERSPKFCASVFPTIPWRTQCLLEHAPGEAPFPWQHLIHHDAVENGLISFWCLGHAVHFSWVGVSRHGTFEIVEKAGKFIKHPFLWKTQDQRPQHVQTPFGPLSLLLDPEKIFWCLQTNQQKENPGSLLPPTSWGAQRCQKRKPHECLEGRGWGAVSLLLG